MKNLRFFLLLIAVVVMSGYCIGYAADCCKDKWNLKGDFYLPKITRKNLYHKLETEYDAGKFGH